MAYLSIIIFIDAMLMSVSDVCPSVPGEYLHRSGGLRMLGHYNTPV